MVIDWRKNRLCVQHVINGLNNKNIPENLQLKLSTEKWSIRKNSVMLVHQNENIKPAYLEEANKVFSDKKVFKWNLRRYLCNVVSNV